jgi:hypothetical protein
MTIVQASHPFAPAKAGAQDQSRGRRVLRWVPAFAGTNGKKVEGVTP